MKQHHLPIGTFINMATVSVGSLIGLWLQQFFPANVQAIIFQAIGIRKRTAELARLKARREEG